MIVADTSSLYAVFNRRDKHHQTFLDVFSAERKIIVPAAILSEATYLLESRVGQHSTLDFIDLLNTDAVEVIWDSLHLPRIRELIDRYKELPLGFADSSVIVLAEQLGGRVATSDRKHFEIVQANRELILVPERELLH